jgi:hypothetical protein
VSKGHSRDFKSRVSDIKWRHIFLNGDMLFAWNPTSIRRLKNSPPQHNCMLPP